MLEWGEFCEWREIFCREDEELEKQKREMESRARNPAGSLAPALPPGRRPRQAVNVTTATVPPFRPPTPGASGRGKTR